MIVQTKVKKTIAISRQGGEENHVSFIMTSDDFVRREESLAKGRGERQVTEVQGPDSKEQRLLILWFGLSSIKDLNVL
jgi:hypothetical protein